PEEYWKIIALLQQPKSAAAGSSQQVEVKSQKTKFKSQKAGETNQQAEQEEVLPEGAFYAELAEWAGEKFKAANGDESGRIVKALEGASYVVSKVEQKDRQEKAHAPFTTSTLQQQAAIRLHYSAKRTMMTAQRLYEGVEIPGEGSVALITYMRTDSTRISED